ncbi:unnamed protein product [Arctia plantaginis]|uniref:Uncharacterized protein n=1 Tax=Arctia plantaginis TaxID=874455 RepID=A0A8S0Z8I2_ARCPL|nr:unnamed protein product [Arctia plantaginis]
MKWILILVLSVLAIAMAIPQRGSGNARPDRVLVSNNNGGYGNTRPDRGYGNTRPDRVLVTNNNGGGLQRPVILPERLPNIPQATGVPREWLRDGK